MKKSLLCLSAFLLLTMAGCKVGGTTSKGEESTPIESVEEPNNKVAVFVLSGQSNMEGSTYFDNGKNWLRNYLEEEEIDPEPFFEGIPQVQTSYRGYYTGSPNSVHASNGMEGKFAPTKVGMGSNDSHMGPELGLAHVLRDYATEEKPIFFIKSAFSSSGFSNDNNYNWKVDSDGGEGKHLWQETKEFVHNNLKLIEEMGFEPEIKAWCWHQGESDSGSQEVATNYLTYMSHLLKEFREEFSDYAPYGDGDEIAFIDCTIFDNTVTGYSGWPSSLSYSHVDVLNQSKMTLAEEPNNYIINASTKDEDGLNLWVGKDGEDGIYHYSTADCFRLGVEYGRIIVENHII